MFKTIYATESTTDILKSWLPQHATWQREAQEMALSLFCLIDGRAITPQAGKPCHPMITLTKAAELIDLLVTQPEKPLDPDLKDALSLGAQALRHIDYHRKAGHFFAQKLLPTEISGNTQGDYWKG